MNSCPSNLRHSQRGVSAVEFALVLVVLLALLFGVVEFGRLFFAINSVQEITRRAAREQVVNWIDKRNAVQHVAVLSTEGCPSDGTVNYRAACNNANPTHFPGAPDITNASVELRFYNTYDAAVAGGPGITTFVSPSDNVEKCLAGDSNCIKFVRATLINPTTETRLSFGVIAPYLPLDLVTLGKPGNQLHLPYSTVIMPAEALGLR
jgi:Flp pilus assembly protein TadG